MWTRRLASAGTRLFNRDDLGLGVTPFYRVQTHEGRIAGRGPGDKNRHAPTFGGLTGEATHPFAAIGESVNHNPMFFFQALSGHAITQSGAVPRGIIDSSGKTGPSAANLAGEGMKL